MRQRLLLLCTLWMPFHGVSAGVVQVRTSNGTITGRQDMTTQVDSFLGIPFAEPPVGDLRLRQAMPLQKPFDTLDANRFGPACYGAGNPANSSEDCLTLNVWRPSKSSSSAHNSLPVMVWLYGGGLTGGRSVSCLMSCWSYTDSLSRPVRSCI